MQMERNMRPAALIGVRRLKSVNAIYLIQIGQSLAIHCFGFGSQSHFTPS